MNEPVTPALLEQGILEQIDNLETATDELAATLLEASAAEHAWKLSRAIAFRSAEGTVPEKEARVDQMTEREFSRHLTAQAVAKAAKEGLETRRAVLSALQSLLRSVSEQVRPI